MDLRPDFDEEPAGQTVDELIFLIEQQRDLITAVATGTTIRPALDTQYKRRRRKIRTGLTRLGMEDPFRWPDLHTWWAFCSAPRMTTYSERRAYTAEITESLLLELERRKASVTDWGEGGDHPPTWTDIQIRLDGLKTEIDTASTIDDLQDVGRRSREILIDAANLVFEDWMVPAGEDTPKAGDAKNRIDHILNACAAGSPHAELRTLVRASWDLANKVTHSTSIGRVDALGAAQAAVIVVRVLQEIAASCEGK